MRSSGPRVITINRVFAPCTSVMAQEDVEVVPGMVRKNLMRDDFGQWLDTFFGLPDRDDLRLVLGFVNGFANYGPRFTDGRITENTPSSACGRTDPANTVIFLPQQIGVIAHEFCHSFTNPVVDKYMDRLQPTGERLYQKARSGLAKQGLSRMAIHDV